MSHRVKPTFADRHCARFEREHSALTRLPPGPVSAASLQAVELISREHDRQGLSPEEILDPNFINDPRCVLPADVSWYSLWRDCRHVYRFDASLAGALFESETPDDMPMEFLLPYPVFAVEAPIEIPLHRISVDGVVTERMEKCRGFFCWQDDVFVTMRPQSNLCFLLVMEDPAAARRTIFLRQGKCTLKESIDENLLMDKKDWSIAFGSDAPDYTEEQVRESRRLYGYLVNLVTYLMSPDPDVRVSYVPSRGTTRNAKACPSTVHDVGTVIGPALSRERVVYVGGNTPSGDGTRPRTHVRVGHWHLHWHGSKKDGSCRLVPHWHKPVIVNQGLADEGGSRVTVVTPVL